MKIRKIATVIAGALMVGATMGAASAASYPDQILNKNVAVVYGTDGADATDMTAANSIQTSLATAASGLDMGTTVTGGESFTLDKSSDHFNYGEALNGIAGLSTLDENDLDFLAKGEYDDGSIDEEYNQEIALSAKTLSLFADNDYNDDVADIGFKWDDGDNILSYTVKYTENGDGANLTLMPNTEIPFLGADYYVLAAEATKITLLDSADTNFVSEGETITVSGKSVSIDFIDDGADTVVLTVDGETTDELGEGETHKLDDDSYIAVTKVLSSSREASTQKVEFALGAGKIIIEENKDVIIGEDATDDIDGLVGHVATDGSGLLTELGVVWNSKKETFLTADDPITMPGLGVIGVSTEGLDTPDSETIKIDPSDQLTIDMGNFDLPIYFFNSTGFTLGEENNPLKIAAATSVTYAAAGHGNGTTPFWEASAIVNTTNLTTGAIAVQEDDKFIVTVLDDDIGEVKQLYYEVTSLEVDAGKGELIMEDQIGSDTLQFLLWDDDTDTDEAQDVTVTLDGFNAANNTAYVRFVSGSDTITYNRAVSEKGLVVTIPAAATTAIAFTPANEDGDVNQGSEVFYANITNSSDNAYVTVYQTGLDRVETESGSKMYKHAVTGENPLATMIMTDEPTGSDVEYDFSIEYFGEEVTADVMVIAGGSTTSEGEINAVAIADSAAAAGKNVVVVGGNCVNTVARTLLGIAGGDGCLAAFEAETGVGNGGVLIQSFDWEGDIALLVAGYSAADTTKAEKALAAAENLDVSVGSKYVLEDTTAADASLVAA